MTRQAEVDQVEMCLLIFFEVLWPFGFRNSSENAAGLGDGADADGGHGLS